MGVCVCLVLWKFAAFPCSGETGTRFIYTKLPSLGGQRHAREHVNILNLPMFLFSLLFSIPATGATRGGEMVVETGTALSESLLGAPCPRPEELGQGTGERVWFPSGFPFGSG